METDIESGGKCHGHQKLDDAGTHPQFCYSGSLPSMLLKTDSLCTCLSENNENPVFVLRGYADYGH